MHVRTNRIGLLSFQAVAPVIEGELTSSRLEFTVRIDEVSTGNPLLDPELHALIHRITSGTLTFTGDFADGSYAGQAQAGSIVVPLTLTASGESPMNLAGRSQFSDVRLPLPGLSHIRRLEVDIDGHLHLG